MNNAQHMTIFSANRPLADEFVTEIVMRPRSEGPLAKLIEDFREEIRDEC